MKWTGPQFPVTIKNGIQVDGCFCVECCHEIPGPKLYSSVEELHSERIQLKSVQDWRNIPRSHSSPLETVLKLGSRELKALLNVLIIDSQDKGYDKVIISREKDANKCIDTLSVGSWSKWMILNFEGCGKSIKGTLRLKLIELSEDATYLRIYYSQIMSVEGWTYPKEIAKEPIENVGPFLQRVGYIQGERIYGAWAGYDTFIEELEYHHEWLARATRYLAKKYDWDLLFVHSHAPDYMLDSIIRRADPLTAVSEEESREFLRLVAKVF